MLLRPWSNGISKGCGSSLQNGVGVYHINIYQLLMALVVRSSRFFFPIINVLWALHSTTLTHTDPHPTTNSSSKTKTGLKALLFHFYCKGGGTLGTIFEFVSRIFLPSQWLHGGFPSSFLGGLIGEIPVMSQKSSYIIIS